MRALLRKLFRRPKSILVIDDEINHALTIRVALETSGYRVILASRGREGVALARRKSPSLILLDIQLPDISGWQALTMLRSGSRTKKIPVIVISHLSQTGDISASFEHGANGHLTKPLSLSKLLNKVDELIK